MFYQCVNGIDWPAWVQAVGSVVAIVFAAGIAIAQQRAVRKSSEEANLLKLRAIIVGAMPELIPLKRQFINKVQSAHKYTSGAFSTDREALVVDFPPAIKRIFEDMSVFTYAPSELQDVIFFVNEYNYFAKSTYQPGKNLGQEQKDSIADQIDSHYVQIEWAINDCVKMFNHFIENAFDAIDDMKKSQYHPKVTESI